jgi:hypothetical protein
VRIIQFTDAEDIRRVGIALDEHTIDVLAGEQTVYGLAQRAIRERQSLAQLLSDQKISRRVGYTELMSAGRILPPIDHSDPAHLLVSGTGLTHLGSADARHQMHRQEVETLTDSMKMFRLGIEGGKPASGQIGVQPEWFYKGDGSCVVAPYGTLYSPFFALDHGEEPEIVGLYLIGPRGAPYRIGFALGNEFSDHLTERQNYLYLAHSKLRPCSFGPELLLGELPRDVRGCSRILRGGQVIWEKPFLSGEHNMSHSIANLEYHHFKYSQFRRQGDVHVHFFGTATLSFADGLSLQTGDEIEIQAEGFGRPLRNRLAVQKEAEVTVNPL